MITTTSDAFDLSSLLSATEELEDEATTKAKEQMLAFLVVLMKCLLQHDPRLYNCAKATMEECAQQNQNKARGFETFQSAQHTFMMRMRQVVGEDYWQQAHAALLSNTK